MGQNRTEKILGYDVGEEFFPGTQRGSGDVIPVRGEKTGAYIAAPLNLTSTSAVWDKEKRAWFVPDPNTREGQALLSKYRRKWLVDKYGRQWYLNVPFSDKEKAEKGGARWDPEERLYFTYFKNDAYQEFEGSVDPVEIRSHRSLEVAFNMPPEKLRDSLSKALSAYPQVPPQIINALTNKDFLPTGRVPVFAVRRRRSPDGDRGWVRIGTHDYTMMVKLKESDEHGLQVQRVKVERKR